MGEPPVRLPDVFRDRSSQGQIRRVEIHVKSNQGGARTNDDGAGCVVKLGGAKIRRPIRIGGHAEGETLQPSSTDRLERGMVAVQGRLFIEEYRDLQLCAHSLSQSFGQMDAVLHRRATQRHEGHDIRCSHSRMNTFVFSKIDEIGRHANRAKGRFNDGVRFTGKAQDRPMVIPIHRLAQQPNPRHGLHGMGQRMHRRPVSPLTEVRHTFDESIHVLPRQVVTQKKPEV